MSENEGVSDETESVCTKVVTTIPINCGDPQFAGQRGDEDLQHRVVVVARRNCFVNGTQPNVATTTTFLCHKDDKNVLHTTCVNHGTTDEHSIPSVPRVISDLKVLSSTRVSYVIPGLADILLPCSTPDAKVRQVAYGPHRVVGNFQGSRNVRTQGSDLYKEAVRVAFRALSMLKGTPAQAHPLKAFHSSFMNHQYAVLTFVKQQTGHSMRFMGFYWQTIIGKSPRSICITFSPCNGHITMTCSCDPMASFNCEHVVGMKDSEFVGFACSSLDKSVHYAEYFGYNPPTPSDIEPLTVIELTRKRFSASAAVSHTRNHQDWSAWMVFDTERNLFIPVIKRFKKKFQCQSCRGSSYKRADCLHELACIAFSPHREHENCDIEDIVESDGEDISRNRGAWEMADIQKYCVQNSRPFLPCPEELKRMKKLSVRIRKALNGGQTSRAKDNEVEDVDEAIILADEKTFCSNDQCPTRPFRGTPKDRQAFLHTLGNGAVKVLVRDWVCLSCQEEEVYRGVYDAIFPFRKESLYTTELLYSLSISVFRWGVPFRTAYGIQTSIVGSPTFNIGLQSVRKHSDQKNSRRRAAEAFRLFISTLETEEESPTSLKVVRLFSCDVCEVEMDDSDRRMFGLLPSDLPGAKRYKGIVIDGTSAGISAELPEYDREQSFLAAPKRLNTAKIVRKKETQTVLRTFIKLAQDKIRYTSRRPSTGRAIRFPLHGPLTQRQIQILRHSIDGYVCSCSTRDSAFKNAPHRARCRALQAVLIDCKEITSLLKAVFDFRLVSRSNQDEGRSETDALSHSSDSDISVEEAVAQRTTFEWEARITLTNASGMSQLLDSLLELIRFVGTEHCALVFIVPAIEAPLSVQIDGASVPHGLVAENGHEFLSPGRPSIESLNLAWPSIYLHRALCNALERLCSCQHVQGVNPCDMCVEGVSSAIRPLSDVNIILYRFFFELIPTLRASSQVAELLQLCSMVSSLCRMQISCAEKYFQELDTKFTKGCREYGRKYGSVMLPELQNFSEYTGICFPDLSMYRPHVVFDQKEKHHCTKKYPKSLRFSPGVLSVECVCKHPKCLGFIIMNKAESTALALSSIIAHFRFPPRAVYYDNGCNLFSSTLTRAPWLLHMTRIAVDRFHYKGHKCCSFFDADYYSFNDGQRTSAAEAINAKLKKTITSLRYLSPDTMLDYLKGRLAMSNVESRFRDKYGKEDLEDVDMTKFFHEIFTCNCFLCIHASLNGST